MELDQILLVIPAHNESATIGTLIDSLIEVGFEQILVVDDGSTDNTHESARDSGALVVRHPINLGVGSAWKTGFKWALRNSGTYTHVLTVDADGQHAAADVLKVAKKMFEGSDLVIGTRKFNTEGTPISRKMINLMADMFTCLLSRKYIKDTQSGLRGIKLEKLKQLELHTQNYAIASEVIVEAVRKGLVINSTEIQTHYTNHSLSKGQKLSNSFALVKSLLS